MSTFGWNEETPEGPSGGGGLSYLPAGINENVYLVDVGYAEAQGDMPESLEVHLRDENGREIQHRWPNPMQQDNTEKASRQFSQIVKNLATKILGDQAQSPQGESFKEFVDNYSAMIKGNPNYNQVPMRVKVVLKQNNYSKLPSYAPIFELMSVPAEQSSLSINSIDKVTPDNPDAESNSNGSTAQKAGTGEDPSGEDPF